MPQGIGYGPLPPPPGLTTAPGLSRITPAPPVDLSLLSPPQPQPVIPADLLPAPSLPTELANLGSAGEPLPPPPGLAQEQQAAPVPAWLQSMLAQRQSDSAAPATPTKPEPTGLPVTQAGAATSLDPRDPISLATAGVEARVEAEKLTLEEMKRARDAIRESRANTAAREAARAERERVAREDVAKQNVAIQQALKQGPGTTWRDVAATGIQIAGAVLGAAFDRSGTLQRNLPNLLQAYVQQGQERTQAAFARQLQALQVGREGAQDELDAAMDDERRIEQAGAAARQAIAEESLRQIQIAAQQGRVDLAEIEAMGLPQQIEAMAAEAAAKRAKLLEEEQRSLQMHNAKLGQIQADTEKTKAEKAQGWARINLDRAKQALDEKRLAAQTYKDKLAVEEQELKNRSAREGVAEAEAGRLVRIPGAAGAGQPEVYIKTNTKEEGKEGRERVAAVETLGQLIDEMTVAADGNTALDKAQTARWAMAVTELRQLANTGTLDKGAMEFVEKVFGEDPASLSVERLRDQKPQLQTAKRAAVIALNNRLRNKSPDFAARVQADANFGVRLPEIGKPEEALPSAEDAKAALLPGVPGKRPRIKPEEYASHVKTVRETIAAEVGSGGRRAAFSDEPADEDAVIRVQAQELADSLAQVRAEKARLQEELQIAEGGAPAVPAGAATGMSPETARATARLRRRDPERAASARGELKQVEEYNRQLSKSLEKERRLLYQRIYARPGVLRAKVDPADVEAYEAVSRLIGPIK